MRDMALREAFRDMNPLTDAQKARIALMGDDWQHIADDTVNGDAILTRPVGCRWLDAHVQADGFVTYSRPEGC
jgi:hypothetical protein